MYCSKCGKKFRNRYKFCDVCGQPLQTNSLHHDIQSWSTRKKRTIVILAATLVIIVLVFITALVIINKTPNGQLASLLHREDESNQKADDIEKDESGTSSDATSGLVLTRDTEYDIDGSILSTTESYQEADYAYKILKDTMEEETYDDFWMGSYSYDNWKIVDGDSIIVKPDVYGRPDSITQVNLGGLARPLSYVCHTMQGELLFEVYYLGSLELDDERSGYSFNLTVPYEVFCSGGFGDTSDDEGGFDRFYTDFYMDSEYSNESKQNGSDEETIDETYKGLITGIWPMVDQTIENVIIKYQGFYPTIDRYDETSPEADSFTKLVIKYNNGLNEKIIEISTDGQLIECVESYEGAVNRFEHYSYDQFRRVTRVDFYRLDSYGIFKGCKFVDSSNYRLPYYTFEYDKTGHMIHQVAHMSSGAKFDLLCLDNKYDNDGRLIETTYYDNIYNNRGDRNVFQWNYDENSALLSTLSTKDESWCDPDETGETAILTQYEYSDDICSIKKYVSDHLDSSDSRLTRIESYTRTSDGGFIVIRTFYDFDYCNAYYEETTHYDRVGNVKSAIAQRFDALSYAHLELEYDENMNITSITELDSHGIKTRFIEFIY